jgi:hypothetical protein
MPAQPDGRTEAGQPHGFPEHEPLHIRGRRTQRPADGNIAIPLAT